VKDSPFNHLSTVIHHLLANISKKTGPIHLLDNISGKNWSNPPPRQHIEKKLVQSTSSPTYREKTGSIHLLDNL
jgi:hypothetical protein